MASQIMNGLGYRNGVHFRTRALALGLGVETVAPSLWIVKKNGHTESPSLDTNEVHAWLDEWGEITAKDI
jgi:hypothetical protein